MCISSVGCPPGTVKLFDSLYQVKYLLADSFQKLEYAPCQQQTNGRDCGIFAIAFATSLLLGSTPQDMTFDIAKMRPHLVACIRAGAMTQLPSF